ncbi:MAG: hypothetical protein M3N48_10175 [Verrucomicrobiota bacterium]|nr:hypothetical protein [Verrucomicrobiota bacterium]
MSEVDDISTRAQRFNDAVRTFTPSSPTRHAKLMPMKESIIELRLIRECSPLWTCRSELTRSRDSSPTEWRPHAVATTKTILQSARGSPGCAQSVTGHTITSATTAH